MTAETAPTELDVVLVCGHTGCRGEGGAVLEALRPLVRRTAHAVLVRTGGCPGEPAPCGGGCRVVLQTCSHDLRPLGPALPAPGPPSEAYRCVERWLDRRLDPPPGWTAAAAAPLDMAP